MWPYLLGHHRWFWSPAEVSEADSLCRASYEDKLGSWLAAEAIVRQKDREATAASIARISKGGTAGTRCPQICTCDHANIGSLSNPSIFTQYRKSECRKRSPPEQRGLRVRGQGGRRRGRRGRGRHHGHLQQDGLGRQDLHHHGGENSPSRGKFNKHPACPYADDGELQLQLRGRRSSHHL